MVVLIFDVQLVSEIELNHLPCLGIGQRIKEFLIKPKTLDPKGKYYGIIFILELKLSTRLVMGQDREYASTHKSV